jgi:hypothetical protein
MPRQFRDFCNEIGTKRQLPRIYVRQCVARKKPEHTRNGSATLRVRPAHRTIPIWQLIFQGLITARMEIQRVNKLALEEARPDWWYGARSGSVGRATAEVIASPAGVG